MQAILSKNNTSSSGISSERFDYYWDSIMPFLLKENWETFDIQLAWDFVTASRESMLGIPEKLMRKYKKSFFSHTCRGHGEELQTRLQNHKGSA